ncbi:sensor histidine kinase [Hufsiella ginkgonis]|uniref:histidine kinase n=1 Tax=Hufsiella ginkgonis TaxID=2695274 RepID=A0A7K1Y0A0_9SPHI|nr:PAS domain-containing sensor histidine kinase [Hufsiella ginkgonis]MXV16653.1 PAS domain-containing protein [Hufsiella ginkgonis]
MQNKSVHKETAGIPAQAVEFISGLLNTDNWPPRWHCGSWTDFHGWLYIVSDLLIWASYFAIPLLLFRMIRRRPDMPFPKIVWLFIAFIVLCGTTHLIDAIIFWWPAYRLSALIRLFTGIVSLVTVYALYKILPVVYSLRTVDQLAYEINERKVAEEKLAASEFLLSEAGRIGRLGGWELDLITRKRAWSKAVYDIYGLPYDHDINATDPFDFFPEQSKKRVKDVIAKALKDGTKWDIELQIITSDQSVIWARSLGEVVYDAAGTPCKMRGVFMDIDKYKTNELALHRSLDLLTKSNQQLKGFTHILSHNIRNHASNISLLTSFVDEDSLAGENVRIFENIKKVSDGLNGTLNDLSEAIKIKESPVTPELIDFEQITRQVLSTLDSEIRRNQAVVSLSFDVPTVLFPKLYMESIVMNLLSNSLKYKHPDRPPLIRIATYYTEDKNCVLEFSDNGLGIDLSLHGNKIFGLYKTFHGHKDAHGVGLFLVKTQVESQNGQIMIDSTPGKGTTFKIQFNIL